MLNQTPESMDNSERVTRWFNEVPDSKLAAYMLLLAVVIATSLYLVDTSLF